MWGRFRVALHSRHSRATVIPFADVKPRGSRLAWFWHGLGIDREYRIYVAIGNGAERRGQPGDVLLFEYDSRSGSKRYLDSVRGILAREGNLAPNHYWPHQEGIAKVHSDIIEHRGMLYFSTHDLHDPENLSGHRGGHLLSYDPSKEQFRVLTRDCPGGVAVAHEGVIALNALRAENQLVGWTYPHGHVLLHDLESGKTVKYRRGPAGGTLCNVARVIVATRRGSIFAAYTGRGAPSCFFKLDREQGGLVPTGYHHDMGFFEGLAETADGRTLYLADSNGELHQLDTQSETFSRLGSILPPEREARGERVAQLRNLTLSGDESKLFSIPSRVHGGPGAYHLYEYDIATGRKTTVADLSGILRDAMLTGNGVMDEAGRIYLSCYFGSDSRMYHHYGQLSGLARIDVSDRSIGRIKAILPGTP